MELHLPTGIEELCRKLHLWSAAQRAKEGHSGDPPVYTAVVDWLAQRTGFRHEQIVEFVQRAGTDAAYYEHSYRDEPGAPGDAVILPDIRPAARILYQMSAELVPDVIAWLGGRYPAEAQAILALEPPLTLSFWYCKSESSEPWFLTHPKFQPEGSPDGLPDALVTLLQVAPLTGLSKRTLERHVAQGTLPSPSYPGGCGKAHKWEWRVLRAGLQGLTKRPLPENFPGSRIV